MLKKMIMVFIMASLPLLMLGQTVEIHSATGLDIELGGEVQFEFIDVEGLGGFAHEDLTYQKVKNRSPYMQIDKAVLEANVQYSENLYYHIEYRFDDDAAYVDKNYARLNLPGISTRIEVGKNRPFVAVKRHTEGYPLIGTAFWKGREVHLVSDSKISLGDNASLEGGVSFAMKRPFDTDDAAEDKSFKMMVYGDYQPRRGQTYEYGAKGGLQLHGLSALGWFYYSELIDDWDWKSMLSQSIAPYDGMGDRTDRTHYWYGGRVAFNQSGFHTQAEYIYAKDGLLPRAGSYVEASYTLHNVPILPLEALEPAIRVGELHLINRHNAAGDELTWAYLAEPMSWDRNMITLALGMEVNDYLTIKAEYYILDENTGSDTEPNVDDNQVMIQMDFKF